MQQEHVLSDKKGEVVLDENAVFVEIYRVRLRHLLNASSDDNITQMAKLIMLTTLFDGKSPTADQVMNLYIEDFNKIARIVSG